jgi:hypothetical protein
VYELVLAPRDTASRISEVRLAIDAKQHLPLRVRVFAAGASAPAYEVGFTQLSFRAPGAEEFRFSPPPGTKIIKGDLLSSLLGGAGFGGPPDAARDPAGTPSGRVAGPHDSGRGRPAVVGTGWTAVLVIPGSPVGTQEPGLTPSEKRAPAPSGDPTARPGGGPANRLGAILGSLPRVSGSWGQGRLLQSKLVSALFVDDGRILVGAVSPERLYAAAASPEASLHALTSAADKPGAAGRHSDEKAAR